MCLSYFDGCHFHNYIHFGVYNKQSVYCCHKGIFPASYPVSMIPSIATFFVKQIAYHFLLFLYIIDTTFPHNKMISTQILVCKDDVSLCFVCFFFRFMLIYVLRKVFFFIN